ncbi:MAG: carbon storage regulator CsrA [Candidatus Pacebacteria bacterium]|nr:carbon storage regulator CsrA [Candidatus Paceibacterota bacterium]
MLVLSRKKGQSIVIGENRVSVVVLAIYGKSVRLGIDAPKDIPVHRKEILEAIHHAKRA